MNSLKNMLFRRQEVQSPVPEIVAFTSEQLCTQEACYNILNNPALLQHLSMKQGKSIPQLQSEYQNILDLNLIPKKMNLHSYQDKHQSQPNHLIHNLLAQLVHQQEPINDNQDDENMEMEEDNNDNDEDYEEQSDENSDS